MIHRELDQFFTTEEVAQKCLRFLSLYIQLDTIDWFEPSAGSGVFIEQAKKYKLKKPIFACDLMVKHQDVIEANFLNFNIKSYINRNNKVLCLGNPPFGKNSSLAIKFFNHAAKDVDYIAMIFPATFAKESVKNKLNLNFHLIAELDLGKVDFDFIGDLRKVPVIFQIWEKNTILREKKVKKLFSNHFKFVKKEEANFAIQRVGGAAGKIKLEFSNCSPSSHYFIKTNNTKVIETFNKIKFDTVKNKTAGNPSISKTELVELFEEEFL